MGIVTRARVVVEVAGRVTSGLNEVKPWAGLEGATSVTAKVLGPMSTMWRCA